MRDDLYRHLQQLPVAFHDRWQTGQLLSRATSDLSTIRRFLSFGLVFLVVNLATFVTVVVLLVRMYAPLGLLVAVSAVPLFLISRSLAKAYLETSRRVQDLQGDLATFIEESAVGVRMIRSFGRREHVGETFRGSARTLHDSAVGKAVLVARFWSLLDLVPSLTLGLTLLFGALAVTRGSMTLGDLVAFVSLMLMLVWPVDSLGWILANGQEAMTAADRVYEVFDTVPTIVDSSDALDLDHVSGRVRFEGVGFRYAGSTTPVLHDVTLEIHPGETLALVGATGSGKTTLTSLVPRLYDVSDGPDHPRRPRHPRPPADIAAAAGVHGLRGRHVVLGERPGEPHPRVPRGHGRRRRAGAGHRAGGVRARTALGTGHPDRRAGAVTVRWPATAARAGQGGDRPAARPRARRPAVGSRRPHRVAGRAGPAPGARHHHGPARGAPPVHGGAGRPGRAARGRHDHRRGDPLRADGDPAVVPRGAVPAAPRSCRRDDPDHPVEHPLVHGRRPVLAGGRHRGQRRAVRRRHRPAAGTKPTAAGQPAASAPQGAVGRRGPAAAAERGRHGRPLPGQGGHRPWHRADRAERRRDGPHRRHRRLPGGRTRRVPGQARLPHGQRPDRPGGAATTCAPGSTTTSSGCPRPSTSATRRGGSSPG